MRQVVVTMHSEDGRWWADSSDVAQFTAAADSYSELRELTREGLEFYLEEPAVELVESVVFEGALGKSDIPSLARRSSWYEEQVTSGITMAGTSTSGAPLVRELNPTC